MIDLGWGRFFAFAWEGTQKIGVFDVVSKLNDYILLNELFELVKGLTVRFRRF